MSALLECFDTGLAGTVLIETEAVTAGVMMKRNGTEIRRSLLLRLAAAMGSRSPCSKRQTTRNDQA